MSFGWHRALAFALVGMDFEGLGDEPVPDVAATLRLLAERGWAPERIAALRRRRADAGEPWPFPLPDDVAGQIGSHAQFQAALVQAQEKLSDGATQVRSSRPLDADERRLLADHPPHYGRG